MNLNSSKLKVLKLFIKHPKDEFYLSQARKMTGLSLDRTHVYLKYWESIGALSCRRCGRMTFYKLKRCRVVELLNDLMGELNV
jgi:uridine phosphorylase